MTPPDLTSWSWAELLPTLATIATEAATGATKAVGTTIAEQTSESVIAAVRKRWAKTRWPAAARLYADNLHKNLSTTRVLGHSRSFNLEDVFTDVYVYDKISAERVVPDHLTDLQRTEAILSSRRERHAAIEIVSNGENLFILGLPGAGKTTFLKYLAITGCKTGSSRTPVFVTLKDWSDSNLTFIDYVANSFDTCGFPDAKVFIRALLSSGRALLLLDGLDEVSESSFQRDQITKEIEVLTQRYRNCQFCVTCRTASTDYSFGRFRYIEVADFTPDQQAKFISQWYSNDPSRLARFLGGWNEAQQKGLRDIAKTPLLLTLVCLAFDDTLAFPTRQVDLYREALDALLRKWDSSRLIVRDPFYQNLSHSRREQLLEEVAAKLFLDQKVSFRRQELSDVIRGFLASMPSIEGDVSSVDTNAVIRQLEGQHGLIVERARAIYTFSHLTIQEYLTAAYVVRSQDIRLASQVAEVSVSSPAWREVCLFISALMPRSDPFLSLLVGEVRKRRRNATGITSFLVAAHCKALLRLAVAQGTGSAYSYQLLGRFAPEEVLSRLHHFHSRNRPSVVKSRRSTRLSASLVALLATIDQHPRPAEFSLTRAVVQSCVDIVESDAETALLLIGLEEDGESSFVGYVYGCKLLVECLDVGLSQNRSEFLAAVLELDEVDVCETAQRIGVTGT